MQKENPIPSPLPTQPRSKTSIILLFVTALILGGFGGYLIGSSKSDLALLLSQKGATNNPSAVTTTSPVPTPDETANWKTYTNPKGEYSFKYPDGLKSDTEAAGINQESIRFTYISPSQGRKEGMLNNGYSFVVTKITINTTVQEQAQKERDQTEKSCHEMTNPNAQISTLGTILINNHPAWQFTIKDCLADSTTLFSENSGKVYRITLTYSGSPTEQTQYRTTLDQILSTFKFTEKTAIVSPSTAPKKISVLSTNGWISVSQNSVSYKIPEGATCVSQYNPEVKDTKNCKFIYLKGAIVNPITVEVADYQNGSRREQFFRGTTSECHEIYEDAVFGGVTALQIAAENGYCQGGAGGIVTVVGNKFVVFTNLGFDPQTKEIGRFSERDTIISTLSSSSN